MSNFFQDLGNILVAPIVLVGVGNRYRGDDAAGSILAERLSSLKKIAAIDSGEIPENYTYDVKQLTPKTIIFVDAVDVGIEPGQVVLLKPSQLTEKRFSTHRPSLRLVMEYLAKETKAQIYLLGLQPKSIMAGAPLSTEVSQTIARLEDIFNDI